MKVYLGVGVVLQVPDQATSEFAHVTLDFGDIIAEGIQFGDHDLVTVNLSIPMPARYQSPRHDNHQDSDGSDYLGQPRQVLQLSTPLYPQHLAYLSVGYRIVGQLGM